VQLLTNTRHQQVKFKDSMELPDGFTARNGSHSDVPDAVKLFNSYDDHYLGYKGLTDNIIETDWNTPKFNPEEDNHMVFTEDGELVGYIEVWAISNPPVHPWLWGRVHPDYHGQGIGTYLMEWGERRAKDAVNRCPVGVRVAYRSSTVNTIEPPKHLLESFNMKLIRHSFRMLIEMDKAPPEPVWSDGITIRSATKADRDIETICRVDSEAFKDHFGYLEQPFEDELAWFSNWIKNDESLNDPSLWFLAMDGEKAVGLALCASWDLENRDRGHVNSLGVLCQYRKRGIGLALLHCAFGEYYRRGKSGVSLGVDAENLTGALNLYKRAGMHIHRQSDLYEKELRPGREISVESLGD
jgi:mycothiol synthase